MTLPDATDVRQAQSRLPHHLQDTPCLEAPWLSPDGVRRVWLKLETLQPTHSFKVRGAMNAVAALFADGDTPRLVTASAGNHGAALSWAAAQRGVPLVVFTPRGAPAAKLERIAAAGADLRAVAADYDEAERLAIAWARETGARYVSPYNDPLVIAGAGTIGLEIAAQVSAVTEVIVPLGGGGLLAGVALALRAAAPSTRIVGAEATASPAFTTALRANAITPFEVGPTLADGLAGNLEPGSITFDLARELVTAVVTVDEPSLRRAMRRLLEIEHVVAEGAGAIGVAAFESGAAGPGSGPGDTVIVVSGANVDVSVLREVAFEG